MSEIRQLRCNFCGKLGEQQDVVGWFQVERTGISVVAYGDELGPWHFDTLGLSLALVRWKVIVSPDDSTPLQDAADHILELCNTYAIGGFSRDETLRLIVAVITDQSVSPTPPEDSTS